MSNRHHHQANLDHGATPDKTGPFFHPNHPHEWIHVIPSHCKTGNCFFHQAPDSCPRHGAAPILQGSEFGPLVPSPRVRPGHPAPPPRKSGVVSYPSMCCFHGFRDSGSQQSVVQRSVVVLCPSEMSRRTPYRVPTGLRREIDGVRPRTVVEVRGVTVCVCVCVCVYRSVFRGGKSAGLLIRWMDGWPCIKQCKASGAWLTSRRGSHPVWTCAQPSGQQADTTHETALCTKLPFSIPPSPDIHRTCPIGMVVFTSCIGIGGEGVCGVGESGIYTCSHASSPPSHHLDGMCG